MQSILRFSVLSLLGFLALPLVQAAEISNVRVEPTPDYVNIFWNGLSTTDLDGADGYAVQFSERQTDVQIIKPANLYLSRGETSIALRRNSFDNDTYYYLRIYTYERGDENAITLGNGSDLIKWRTDYWNKVESTAINVNDPVVSTAVSSSGSSNTTNKDDIFDIGYVRTVTYDTFADFSWSRPTLMADSDYDGFLLQLSTEADLGNPIIEATIDQDEYKTRVKGLTPGTNYYVKVSFYDRSGGSNVPFGNKNIDSFRTLNAIPRDGSTRAARNIAKLETKVHGRTHYLNDASTTSTTTSSTTTASTSTNTTVTTSSSNTDIRTRIAALKRQISSLQSELRTLEARIGVTPSTTVTTRTQTSTSTSSSSRLSKLRALLEARRNR